MDLIKPALKGNHSVIRPWCTWHWQVTRTHLLMAERHICFNLLALPYSQKMLCRHWILEKTLPYSLKFFNLITRYFVKKIKPKNKHHIEMVPKSFYIFNPMKHTIHIQKNEQLWRICCIKYIRIDQSLQLPDFCTTVFLELIMHTYRDLELSNNLHMVIYKYLRLHWHTNTKHSVKLYCYFIQKTFWKYIFNYFHFFYCNDNYMYIK